jgi:hypothetical protein
VGLRGGAQGRGAGAGRGRRTLQMPARSSPKETPNLARSTLLNIHASALLLLQMTWYTYAAAASPRTKAARAAMSTAPAAPPPPAASMWGNEVLLLSALARSRCRKPLHAPDSNKDKSGAFAAAGGGGAACRCAVDGSEGRHSALKGSNIEAERLRGG